MRKFLQVLFITFLLGLLMACGADSSDNETVSENTDEPTEEQATEEEATEDANDEEAFPVTITDARGEEVTIEEEPEEIVSLMPSNTEITFALGQGDKVVGVTDYDIYPEEVAEIEKIGAMELNVELILSLEPDLVMAHELNINSAQEAFEQFENAGIQVVAIEDAQDIETTYSTIETIGEIVGAQDEAEEIIKEMQQGFAELEELTATVAEEDRQSVFFENSPAPEIYTAGQNTFIQELLEIIHAENAARELDGWVALDPEAIIELNPDVIVTSYGNYVDNPVEEVMSRSGFEVVSAVENERVYDLDADIVSRSGPRLVEGARALAEVTYPELFDEE